MQDQYQLCLDLVKEGKIQETFQNMDKLWFNIRFLRAFDVNEEKKINKTIKNVFEFLNEKGHLTTKDKKFNLLILMEENFKKDLLNHCYKMIKQMGLITPEKELKQLDFIKACKLNGEEVLALIKTPELLTFILKVYPFLNKNFCLPPEVLVMIAFNLSNLSNGAYCKLHEKVNFYFEINKINKLKEHDMYPTYHKEIDKLIAKREKSTEKHKEFIDGEIKDTIQTKHESKTLLSFLGRNNKKKKIEKEKGYINLLTELYKKCDSEEENSNKNTTVNNYSK